MRGKLYDLTIERESTTDNSNAEGVPTPVLTTVAVCGTLSMLSAAERRAAEHYGEHVSAASHLPVGTEIDHMDFLRCDDECAPEGLRGRWIVEAVSTRRTFLRVLLRREEHP